MGALADKYRVKTDSLADKYRVKLEDDPLLAPESTGLDFLKQGSGGGAAMHGVQQGVTLGFADEAAGALGVAGEASKRLGQTVGIQAEDPVDLDPALNPNSPAVTKSWGAPQPAGDKPVTAASVDRTRPSLADVYRNIRDRDRTANKASQEAHPWAYGLGELAGGVALPVPGAALMKGAPLVAKAGLGAATAAGLGTAYGLGKSESEDIEGMRNDALKNGLVAAPFGAAGAAVGHVASKLGERFGARAGEVKAAKAVADAEKITGTNKSGYGTASAAGYRTLEKAQADLANEFLPQAEKEAAAAFLASAEGRELALQISRNNIAAGPEKLGAVVAAKEKFANSADEAKAFTDDYFSKSTLKEDVLPRVKNYASRMIPQGVASAMGDMAGGAQGVAAGFAGALTGAALGKPGTSWANLMQKTPRFNAQLFEKLQSGGELSETALQKLATQLGVKVEDLAGDQLRQRFGGE